MKRLLRLAALLLCTVACFACDDDRSGDDPKSEIKRYTIASHRIYAPDAVSTLPVLCYLVKPAGAAEWQCFHNTIAGFDYQAGTEYDVELEVIPVPNPPADASDREYRLRRILRQEAAASSGLPDGAVSE